jgi:hypothetical protein
MAKLFPPYTVEAQAKKMMLLAVGQNYTVMPKTIPVIFLKK